MQPPLVSSVVRFCRGTYTAFQRSARGTEILSGSTPCNLRIWV